MDRRRSRSNSVLSGIYILEIKSLKSFLVEIKKYKGIIFDKGYYYYVGSAQKNLDKRLFRHQQGNKKIHWHIDHLTTISSNNIERIFIIPYAKKDVECEVANQLENILKLDSSIKGFGNSDSNCSSTHLFYSKRRINHNHLFSLYQSMVRLIPSDNEIS